MINNRSDKLIFLHYSVCKRDYYAVCVCWSSQSSAAKTRSPLDIRHTLLVSKARRPSAPRLAPTAAQLLPDEAKSAAASFPTVTQGIGPIYRPCGRAAKLVV